MRHPIRIILPVLVAACMVAACTPRHVPPEPAEPDTGQTPPEEPPPPPREPEPPAVEEPAEEPAPEPAEAEPPPEPEGPADPLYERTEEALRLEFSNALRDHYGMEVDPDAPDRLDAADLRAWLADLDGVAPEVAARVREVLGRVLDQRYAVGFILPDAVEARCARFEDIVYVAVPERFRRAGGLVSDGLLIRDTCVPPADELCLVCAGGATGQDGACRCVCTLDTCPAVRCAAC